MVFEDRKHAGELLGQKLLGYREENPLILALPRGGVVVAYEVAVALKAALDVIIARKIGAPSQPELGIGAIAPGGVTILDDYSIRYLGITPEQIQPVVEQETAEMERRLRHYRGDRPMPDMRGQTVILIDDGLATGVTARAAIRAIRKEEPGRLVLAVPVCAAETARAMRFEVDDLVCLNVPEDFRAVGYWYRNFDQTSDEEVMELLHRAEPKRTEDHERNGSPR